jgi:hypothetical protein
MSPILNNPKSQKEAFQGVATGLELSNDELLLEPAEEVWGQG